MKKKKKGRYEKCERDTKQGVPRLTGENKRCEGEREVRK